MSLQAAYQESGIRPVSDDEISLLDMLYRFLDFWRARRAAIIACVVIGPILGMGVAVFFNPWSVQLNIRNENGFFSLNDLKSMQTALRDNGPDLLDAANGSETNARLRSKLTAPNWIEQNIVPDLSFSKTDLRSSALPDKAAEAVGQNSQLLYLQVNITDADANEARNEARILGDLCLRLTLRDQIKGFLLGQVANLDAERAKLEASLPGAIIGFETVDRHLNLARDLQTKYPADRPELRAAQLSISNLVGSGADQIKYLPLETQLSGLEIEQGLRKTELEQLSFRIKVNEYLFPLASKALVDVASDPTAFAYLDRLQSPAYWKGPESASDTEEWKKEYRSSILNTLLFDQKALIDRYRIVASSPRLVTEKHVYRTSMTVLAGFGLGLLAALALFLFDAVRRAIKDRHMVRA
jgi:hypothetical protein